MKFRILLLLSALFFACGDDDGIGDAAIDSETDAPVDTATDVPPVDGGSDFEFCAEQSDEEVPLCTRAFESGVRVRLPPDEEGVVYGGISTRESAVVFQTRLETFPLASELTRATVSDPGLLKRADSHFAYFLFRATVESGMVQSVTPIVQLDDRVMMRPLLGLVLEGRMSLRESEDRFEFPEPSMPVRVRLASEFLDEPSELRSTGFDSWVIRAEVENATSAVLSADGACLPATTESGEANVFDGIAAPVLRIRRHPDMHGGFDSVFTMDWPEELGWDGNNMGSGLYLEPTDFIAETFPEIREAGSSPHGTPWSAPQSELAVVEGGGGACPSE